MKISLTNDSAMRSPEFIFGVATSSFQIEGAAERRLPSIWDTFCDTPGKISDRSNGRTACDHLARWEEDVDLIASLGVDAYRFSISWPRVMKKNGTPNASGINFYIRLLDKLLAKGIKPFVTLYHWDLPQHIEDDGGWLNRETAYRFRDYVKQIALAFGDRVYSYATLNEPLCSAYLGYEVGVHAPGLNGKVFGKRAAHNLLLAHGLAMQVLEKHSPHSRNGIVLNFSPCYPATTEASDIAAAERADETFNQWFIKPIIEGRYPDLLESLPAMQIPEIHEGDMEIISHPIDFLGVNYYTRAVYRADGEESFVQLPPLAPLTDMGWEIYPKGLTNTLVALNNKYKLPPVFITESGAAMSDRMEQGRVNDTDRIQYMQSHLDAVDDAIEHGVQIDGYFCWSLMDNFEWALGYEKRFGIVYVDFATQQRTIKASGCAYRDLLGQRRTEAAKSV